MLHRPIAKWYGVLRTRRIGCIASNRPTRIFFNKTLQAQVNPSRAILTCHFSSCRNILLFVSTTCHPACPRNTGPFTSAKHYRIFTVLFFCTLPFCQLTRHASWYRGRQCINLDQQLTNMQSEFACPICRRGLHKQP